MKSGADLSLRPIVDNTIRHALVGARVDVSVCRGGETAVVQVVVDDPGIPAADLPTFF